ATAEPAAPQAQAAPAAPPAQPAAPAPAPTQTNLGREPSTSPNATTPPPADSPVFAAPSTRHLARQIGVDLPGITGTGPHGRITEDDVKRHAREQTSRPIIVQMTPQEMGVEDDRQPLPDFAQWGEITREPLSRLRRTVVRNMAQSWSE